MLFGEHSELIYGLCRDYIGFVQGLYRDYTGVYRGLALQEGFQFTGLMDLFGVLGMHVAGFRV